MVPQPFIYAHYASTIYIWPFRYDTQPSCHLYFRYGVDTIECGFTKTHAWHDNNMQYNSCIWTERQISCQGFYLWVFSILHSIKRLITKKKLSQYKGRNNYVDLVLKTCLRFYLYVFNNSISGSFFFRKTIFGFIYHDTHDSFPLGWCVDRVVGNWENYQE